MLSTSSLAIVRVTCLAALTSAAALNGPAQPQKSSRRTFLAGVAATPLLVAGPLKSRAASTDGPRDPQVSTDGRRDPRTTSAFFGLAAPPIQGMWSYAELVEQAKAENLATIQTAVQHDCIVATTHEGMRFASMVADKTVPLLLIDCEKPDGSLPFEVLPIDENRAAVRDVASQLLNLLGVLWLADQADLLPWDTTPYGSLAEREAAQRGGAKVRKKLLARLRSAFETMGQKKKKTQKGARRVEHDEDLRRVLGLVRWDAAAELNDKLKHKLEHKIGLNEELKQRIEFAGSEMAQQLKEAQQLTPGELLEKEVGKVPGAFAKVPGVLKRIAWATPACVSLERMPTFEQLCTRAWCISACKDSGVTQYLRACPTAAPWPVPEPGAAVAEPSDDTALGRLAGSLGSAALLEGRGSLVFDAELGLCRIDEEFSAFYGRRVYLCKRLENVVPA